MKLEAWSTFRELVLIERGHRDDCFHRSSSRTFHRSISPRACEFAHGRIQRSNPTIASIHQFPRFRIRWSNCATRPHISAAQHQMLTRTNSTKRGAKLLGFARGNCVRYCKPGCWCNSPIALLQPTAAQSSREQWSLASQGGLFAPQMPTFTNL